MDGYEFTERVRAAGDNTPILMVTARDLPEEKCKGFRMGTDDYMVKPVNEEELLLRIKALLRRSQIASKHKIAFDSQEYFLTDNEEMLQQVWIDLLDNAIKFSPAGGVISVTISQDAFHTNLTFSNEGGIEPAAQAHIFDKFYQADRSHTTPGNGLGLSIVKKIVDLHGGNIAVDSDTDTTFAVSLHNELPR